MEDYILSLENITKVYGNGTVANKNVNLNLKQGEIHAIVGENGAGKSTLMKILFGEIQPTSGKIVFKGKEVKIENPNVAIDMGIGMVHQHFQLINSFTVAENLNLSIEPKKGLFIDVKKSEEITKKVGEKYNLPLNPSLKVSELTVGMKQKLEILKALVRGAKILILDEPTAVLTPQETEELFEQLIDIKKLGFTIIFISHKLKEVKKISDRITIIRKGKTEGVFETESVTEKDISKLMVGRDLVLEYHRPKNTFDNEVLRVEGVNLKPFLNYGELKNINFSINSGEILGIAGVEGNGQNEIIDIITREITQDSGNVLYKGEDIFNKDILSLRNNGLGYIPEDRMTKGIAKDASIAENAVTNRIQSNELCKKGIIDSKRVNTLSEQFIEEYKVLCSSKEQPIGSLSGGNIQKVVVARECSNNPNLLIAEQPTRGVDLGAIEFIHKKILDLRNNGVGVLLVSADLNEVIELSDKLIVVFDGEIVAYFEDTKNLTEETLGLYMLGIEKQEKNILEGALK